MIKITIQFTEGGSVKLEPAGVSVVLVRSRQCGQGGEILICFIIYLFLSLTESVRYFNAFYYEAEDPVLFSFIYTAPNQCLLVF